MIVCKKYNTSNLPEQCWWSNKSCAECLEEDKRHKEAVAKIRQELDERRKHFEFGW